MRASWILLPLYVGGSTPPTPPTPDTTQVSEYRNLGPGIPAPEYRTGMPDAVLPGIQQGAWGLSAPDIPRVADLEIPGDPRLVRIARQVILARIALNPDLAASVGLFEDAIAVPSYTAEAVAERDARLLRCLRNLARLPWRTWDIDQQIDARWLQANAEEARHRLTVEQAWKHRYGEYLEPVANTFVSLTTYAPDRVDLRVQLAALLPAMLEEMAREVTEPTARDVTTGLGLLDGLDAGIAQLPEGSERTAAAAALGASRALLLGRSNLPEFKVIGATSYAWRYKHALLLPWTPTELLAHAESELTRVEARLATLPKPGSVPISEAHTRSATTMDRAAFLGLYEGMVARNLAALKAMNVLTVPSPFPTMHARETPDALIPLTGDGGSMNPPLAFGATSEGWWNVQHFRADWPLEQRERMVADAEFPEISGLGPYAVHEGVPGHHLQLAMLRGLNPIHTILQDGSSVEGWALYAEQLFWEGGGFGTSEAAEATMLRSYRGRIRRVVYDVHIETGDWSLQEGANWKAGAAEGVNAALDPDVLRTIQWPTQLVWYYAGKSQILALREEVRQKQGAAYSERAFNDAILGAGPIPISLVRAKILGVAVP